MDLDVVWPELEQGIRRLTENLTTGFSNEEYMQLYTRVYNYCTPQDPQRHTSRGARRAPNARPGATFIGEALYHRMESFLQAHLANRLTQTMATEDEQLLTSYAFEWRQFRMAMRVVGHIFEYLNRHWIRRALEENIQGIYEVPVLGLVLWRDRIFARLSSRLTNALLVQIHRERSGEAINVPLIREVITSYVTLEAEDKTAAARSQIYKQHFENPFILATEQFYAAEAAEFLAGHSVSDYLRLVEDRLSQEVVRVNSYLHQSSMTDLIQRCELVFIVHHLDLLRSEFGTMLSEERVEDLGRLYQLLKRVDGGLNPLYPLLESHVARCGQKSVEDIVQTALQDPGVYVDVVLQVYRKFHGYVKGCFNGDVGFVTALDRACRSFVNDNEICRVTKSPSKSPELLARHVDTLLKKSLRSTQDSDLEEQLSESMVMFSYLEDKDVFQTFYSKNLAKRLIQGTSASEDLESTMIAKLKSACGFEYTSKLQRVFNDMAVSRDLQDRFSTYLLSIKAHLELDFSVMVLATGSWPLQHPSSKFAVPAVLRNAEEMFERFYGGQHRGRKLTWLHQFSKGELRCLYGAKIHFIASTYQIGLLLLFDDVMSISLPDMAQQSLLSENVLRGTLASLLKLKILSCEPAVPDDANLDEFVFDRSHEFSLNVQFRSKRKKININVPIRTVQRVEDDETQRALEEDRKLQIQAAIVRVMKARRQLHHNTLIAEVIDQLQSRFKPRVPVIKKCIDMLIEREYLERVEGSKDVYSYIL